jgi:hypothetical protein
MSADMSDNTQGWVKGRERRESRRATVELCMTVIGAHVVLLSLLLQLRYGLLRHVPAQKELGAAVLVMLPALSASMVIAPTLVISASKKVLHVLATAVFGTATKLLLAVVYLAVIPFGYFYGRRSFSVRHPRSAAWASRPTGDWVQTGWVPKISEAEQANRSARSPVWRLLGYFVAQRNIFALVVAAIIVVVLSVSVLSHSSTLAPFVYTLF